MALPRQEPASGLSPSPLLQALLLLVLLLLLLLQLYYYYCVCYYKYYFYSFINYRVLYFRSFRLLTCAFAMLREATSQLGDAGGQDIIIT